MEKKKRGRPKKIKEEVQGESYWENRPKDDTKRDWGNEAEDWIDDYIKSVNHPHRDLILEALRSLEPIGGLLEIGCNVGPNLLRIQEIYPEMQLAGIDVNEDVLERAKKILPKPMFKQGSVLEIPFEDKSFGVVLCDAVFIYVDPDHILQAMKEITRVASKGVILIEWYDESLLGVVKDYHWARDYANLLGELGFEVKEVKINEWPTKNWEKNGYIYVAHRQ